MREGHSEKTEKQLLSLVPVDVVLILVNMCIHCQFKTCTHPKACIINYRIEDDYNFKYMTNSKFVY